jgi:hypothetical protein
MLGHVSQDTEAHRPPLSVRIKMRLLRPRTSSLHNWHFAVCPATRVVSEDRYFRTLNRVALPTYTIAPATQPPNGDQQGLGWSPLWSPLRTTKNGLPSLADHSLSHDSLG